MDVVSNDFDPAALDGGKKSPVKKSKQVCVSFPYFVFGRLEAR